MPLCSAIDYSGDELRAFVVEVQCTVLEPLSGTKLAGHPGEDYPKLYRRWRREARVRWGLPAQAQAAMEVDMLCVTGALQ